MMKTAYVSDFANASQWRFQEEKSRVSFQSPVHLSPRTTSVGSGSRTPSEVSDLEAGSEEFEDEIPAFGAFDIKKTTYGAVDCDELVMQSPIGKPCAEKRSSCRSLWVFLLLTAAAAYAFVQLRTWQENSGVDFLNVCGNDWEINDTVDEAPTYNKIKVKVYGDRNSHAVSDGPTNSKANETFGERCATISVIGGCTLFGFGCGYLTVPWCCGMKGKKNTTALRGNSNAKVAPKNSATGAVPMPTGAANKKTTETSAPKTETSKTAVSALPTSTNTKRVQASGKQL